MGGSKKPHHFVLVHGICHGAWCWYKVIPLLRSGGHRVTALDLGACGIHPKKLDETATASEYVQPLTDFLGRLPDDEKVVLVGHSYGGLAISMAMESFPNKVLVSVFLSAYMPNSNHAPATLIQEILPLFKFQEIGVLYQYYKKLQSIAFGRAPEILTIAVAALAGYMERDSFDGGFQ